MWRVSRSPGRRPGNASARDQAIRVPEPLPCIGSVKSLESVPNRRVCTRTGTSTAPPPRAPRGLPVTRRPVAVGGRGRERAAVGARELARRHFAPRLGVDVRVHARVVAPRPGGGEPFGELVRVGGGVARAGDRADHEGEAREREHAEGTAAP